MTSLAGVRVLDLSRVLAGPWCTQLLADYGATVLKLEHPSQGDETRGWGPPYLGEGDDALSAYFIAANRNKLFRSVDFATSEGRALIEKLLAHADVLVENFRPGTLAKYGLDYASLGPRFPRLVYCSISGFGPESQQPGYDFVIQAMGGLMSVTGTEAPTKVGVAVADLMTGMYATTAILAALRHRDLTGQGQKIDVALFDTQVAMLANQASNYLVGHKAPKRLGNAHPNIVPYQMFHAQDGELVIAVGNDAQFARLCDALELPDLKLPYARNEMRVRERDVLVPLLSARIGAKTRAHWLTQLAAHDVPAGPVQDIAEVFASAPKLVQTIDGVPTTACPVRMSATPVQYTHAPARSTPLVTEDTELLR